MFCCLFSLKGKTVCTVKTAKWATGAAGVVLAAFNINNFFSESHIKSDDSHTCLFTYDDYVDSIISVVDSSLY